MVTNDFSTDTQKKMDETYKDEMTKMDAKGNVHEEGMTFGSKPSNSSGEEWVEEDFGKSMPQAHGKRSPRGTKRKASSTNIKEEEVKKDGTQDQQ